MPRWGRLAELRQAVELYQIERMKRTHAELLESAEYGPISRFFLDDIYVPGDRTRRDRAFTRVTRFFRPFLPRAVVEGLERLLALNHFSILLDEKIAKELDRTGRELPLDEEAFVTACRGACRRDELEKRIEMTLRSARWVFALARKPGIERILSTLQAARRRFGLDETLGFLDRGYEAFLSVGDPEEFLESMHRGEIAYLDSVYPPG